MTRHWAAFRMWLYVTLGLVAMGCAGLETVGDKLPDVRSPQEVHRNRLVAAGCYQESGTPIIPTDPVDAYACMLRSDDYRAVWRIE